MRHNVKGFAEIKNHMTALTYILATVTSYGIMVIRPPGTLVPEGLMFYCRCFFFPFFIRRATSELPPPIAAKLCHMIAIWVFFIMQVQKFGGPSPPPKKLGAKNMQNSARFQTTSKFDREYLRNGSRYPKSENVLFESDSSRVPRKKSGEFLVY